MDDKGQRPRLGRPARVPGEKPTKERILESAIDLFADQGYGATSVRQIATALGLTEGAIYRHYAGKDAILKAIFAYAERRIYAPLPIEDALGEPGGESIFRGLLRPLPALIEGDSSLVKITRIMFAEMHHDAEIRAYFRKEYVERANKYMEALFGRCIANGSIRSCDPCALARLFNSFRSEWIFQTYIVDQGDSRDCGAIEKDLNASIRLFEQLLLPGPGRRETESASEV
jgi:AcrR family transcriptional regulator